MGTIVKPFRPAFVLKCVYFLMSVQSGASFTNFSTISIHTRRIFSARSPPTILESPGVSSLSPRSVASETARPQNAKYPGKKSISIQMGYLPPSPKGPFEEVKSILPAVFTGALVALFFASPLGSIFFAIFNSIFVLALFTPLIIYVGFQIWAALFTVEAPCPSCGVLPIRAVKNELREPSVCFNCGAFSRVNEKGDGLELCNNPYDMMSEQNEGFFDQLFGRSRDSWVQDSEDIDSWQAGNQSKDGKKMKRQGTIIDVDVQRDE